MATGEIRSDSCIIAVKMYSGAVRMPGEPEGKVGLMSISLPGRGFWQARRLKQKDIIFEGSGRALEEIFPIDIFKFCGNINI